VLSQSPTVEDNLTNAFVHEILDLVAACRWRLEDACGEGWTLMAGNVHDAICMSDSKGKRHPTLSFLVPVPQLF